MPANVNVDLDPRSSMSAALACFADLLPTEVRAAPGYADVETTLAELPQVFMSNGFGIEHELAAAGEPGRNTLSVSVATELPGVGRLNLARFMTRHLGPWLVAGPFRATLERACAGLCERHDAAVFPERCYFGFEVADRDAAALRIAGVVWSYFMHAGRLATVAFEDLYAQLLGLAPGSLPASIATLRELCGDVRPLEIGHGVRAGRELFKAYPALRFGDSAGLLARFDAGPARELRRALERLGRRLPAWDSFCVLDVIDGRLVRLGYEFNLEEPGARERHVPVLLESALTRELFPPEYRPAIVEGLGRGPLTRTNARGQRCSFEITHLKVSIDEGGALRWKAYFAFRAFDVYPATVPILLPWTRCA